MINIDKILLNFPDINLSYDKILHRKVYSDIYILVPKGKKGYLWFTIEEKNNICYFLELYKNKIINIKKFIVSFDKELSYNTIIFGTLYVNKDNNFFSCENIFYFKGNNVEKYTFKEKFDLYYDLFKNYLNQNFFNKNYLYIGLPYFTNNPKEIFKNINLMHYPVSHVLYINLNKIESEGIIFNNKDTHDNECTFKVKSCYKEDIYELYSNNNKFYDYALIMEYKKSVFMNNIFRNIKENYNLDLLEESDDEVEFENIEKDKYILSCKEVFMKCIFNKKFKKWEPIEISNYKNLLNKKEIQKLEQN